MKTVTCLTLIAIGAIFTFAITAHPSFLNLQVAGLVVMATGVAGLLLPRRGQEGWLRRRIVLRKGAHGPVVGHVDETRYPPYIMLNPGASATADEEADQERSSTIPDVRATDKAGRPDDRGVPVESEIVEEYLQE
jgi:hypothetical protein